MSDTNNNGIRVNSFTKFVTPVAKPPAFEVPAKPLAVSCMNQSFEKVLKKLKDIKQFTVKIEKKKKSKIYIEKNLFGPLVLRAASNL